MFAQNYAPEPSGNAPYVTSLAEGLQASGQFDVTVVTAHPYYPEWRIREGYGQWSREDRQRGVRVRRKLHYVPSRPTSVRRLLSELSFGVRSAFSAWGHPDAVVLVSPSMFACALTMVRARLFSRDVPVLVWVQDLYTLGVVETGAGSATGGLMRRIEGALLRASDRTVVIHERFRASVQELFHLESDRVEVIRNWTHISPVPTARRSEARRLLGWSDDEIVALHTGNMGVKQGLETVVRAAALADAEDAPVRFVLLGGGNQRERLVQAAAGVQRLEFIASLPDDEYALALVAADVLLVNELPGVSGMAVPSKLTSYFAAGRPVVASTDAGSVTDDEVRASGAGLCVPAGDEAALLRTVLSLGGDPERCDTLGAAGVRYYERLLSSDAAMGAFGRAIRQTVADREGAGHEGAR